MVQLNLLAMEFQLHNPPVKIILSYSVSTGESRFSRFRST